MNQNQFNQKYRPGVVKTQTPNLRAQIRAGMGLDRPAQEQRANLDARVERAMTRAMQAVDRVIAKADEASRIQQAAYTAPTVTPAPQWGTPTRLALPKTGEVGKGYPTTAHVVTRAATTPAGAAAAAVSELREGPEPKLVYRTRKRGLTPAQAARQHLR